MMDILDNYSKDLNLMDCRPESEESYRAFFELAAVGMAQADPLTGHWLRVNRKFCEITGYSTEELLGMRIPEITHPDDRQDDWEAFQKVVRGEAPAYRKEKRYRRKDGSLVWVNVNVNVLRDNTGKPTRSVATIEDITDRKQAEAALREANDQLELRVQQRTADLAEINEVLRREIAERNQAEAALRESEARYRVLFENNMDAVFLTVPDGRITAANQAACEMFGRSAEEICKAGRAGLVHPDDSNLAPFLEKRARTGKSFGELSHVRKDGTIFLSETSSVIIPGEPQRSFVIVRDITRRKRAETALRASEEGLARAQAIAHLGNWALETDTQRLTWSDEVYRIFGLQPQEIEATYEAFLERVHPDDRAIVQKTYLDSLDNGSDSFVLENRIIRKDTGEVRHVYKKCEHQRDATGRVIRSFGMIHDITERKRAEDTLCRVIAQLAEADRRKDEFLAMLAHELRNPLAPVRNAINLLSQDTHASAFNQRQHAIIERQVTHMARLLDDLLDVSRITHGKIELKKRPLPLAEMLAQAIETSEPLIQIRGQILNVALPSDSLLVEGDPDRLVQIVGNLLSNAAKYTEAGGAIWLEAAREGGEAVIRLRDSGMGISPEIMPRIFDLFAQADHSLDRAQGGLGIGLTLVKNLVEMHGGTIAAHSEGPGQGSEFVLRLPVLDAGALAFRAPRAPAAPASEAVGHRRILVVDDIADTAQSMVELLESWGHQGRAVFDGHAALSAVREFQPDTVLLDIGLPVMNGYEVAWHLRAEYGPALLLIALTGYGQESDRQLALEAGFNEHLTKPVDLSVLRSLLARLPEKAGACE